MHFATTYVGAGNGRIGQDVNARKFTTSDPSLHTSFDLAQSANINPSSISKKNLQILEQRKGAGWPDDFAEKIAQTVAKPIFCHKKHIGNPYFGKK
jgi:hypothetical protein